MLAAESKLIPLAISHRLLGHSGKQHAQRGLLVPGMVVPPLLPSGLPGRSYCRQLFMFGCGTQHGYQPAIPVTPKAEAGRSEAEGQTGEWLI